MFFRVLSTNATAIFKEGLIYTIFSKVLGQNATSNCLLAKGFSCFVIMPALYLFWAGAMAAMRASNSVDLSLCQISRGVGSLARLRRCILLASNNIAVFFA